MTRLDDLWAMVAEHGDSDDCLEWPFSRTGLGYGQVRARGRPAKAHRLVMGDPEGLVLHTCDNPPCFNPRHLYVGDMADNVRDMIERGRNSPPPHIPGEQCGSAKLTEAEVLAIRATYAAGGVLQRELAVEYGVTRSAIGRIVRRNNWAHV